MRSQGDGVRAASMDNHMEKASQMGPSEGRKGWIERILWTPGESLGTCDILCEGFPFWNLITGITGLSVEVI